MITLAKVRDWLKAHVECPNWYIGKIDGKKEQCIGIYGIQSPPPRIAVGGLDNTSYTYKTVSILVHWGKNADTAERKAQEVYVALIGRSNFKIGGKRVIMTQMRTAEPVAVGTDENNIYEFVIEVNIFYER